MVTRDYKTPRRTRPNRARRGGSGFFWFVTGAVFGAFGVGLAWMLQGRTPPSIAPSPQTRAEPPTKPSFVFHQLLPEMEVLVPEEELSTAAPTRPQPKPAPQNKPAQDAKPEPQQPAPAPGGASYLVQIASFSKVSDAQRLKAKIALLGVPARIQHVRINGKTYHRVRAGPYKSTQEVSQTRALLSSNGLEGIVVKLK